MPSSLLHCCFCLFCCCLTVCACQTLTYLSVACELLLLCADVLQLLFVSVITCALTTCCLCNMPSVQHAVCATCCLCHMPSMQHAVDATCFYAWHARFQPADVLILQCSLAAYISACMHDLRVSLCIQLKNDVPTQQLWCNSDIYHFDLSYWAFQQLAHPTYGVMMVDFR